MRILLLVLAAASVASASSSVKGTVVDEDGNSVPARVLLLNPVDQKVLYATDALQGTFRIESVAPQSYFVDIRTQGFPGYTDAVSVAQDQAVDMGRITLYVWRVRSRFEYRGVQVVVDSEPWPTPSLPEPEYVDAHVRAVLGFPKMTVCEYLNLRSVAPIWYPEGAVVIGILVVTPQGSYLRQSCRDTLRSGDYSWPNAIALEVDEGSRNFHGRLNWSAFLPYLTRPSDKELDPRDREGRWAAFFGRLETTDKLVAVPCGSGKQCAYGFGAISAPAQLIYSNRYVFGGTK